METAGLTISRTGIPCMWEWGGSYTNKGSVLLIADPSGNPKKAIYICTHGPLACEAHALIPVREGDTLLSLDRHRDAYWFTFYRITHIEGKVAELEKLDTFYEGHLNMLNAAVDKSNRYHCREAVYIQKRRDFNSHDEKKIEDDDIYDEDIECDDEDLLEGD